MWNHLNFLSAFGNQKVKDLTKNVTEALVAFDPKGATEAQISIMEGNLDTLGLKVAEIQRNYDEAKRELAEATALNTKRIGAAEALQHEIETGGSSGKEGSLNKLIEIIEQAQPEIEQLKADEADVKSYLDELTAAYNEAATKLKGAREQLKKAERDMDRAKVASDRAKGRAETAAIAAGVRTGGDTLNVAITAMTNKTAAMRDLTNAANLKAATLSPIDHEQSDPNIAAAMNRAAGKPASSQSAAERLQALKGKAAA